MEDLRISTRRALPQDNRDRTALDQCVKLGIRPVSFEPGNPRTLHHAAFFALVLPLATADSCAALPDAVFGTPPTRFPASHFLPVACSNLSLESSVAACALVRVFALRDFSFS